MDKKHRRDFLKKSILGISAAAIAPGVVKASTVFDAPLLQDAIPDLPSRILGRTGLKTPLISLGAGGAYDPNFVKAAYYAGIKFFFSATYYGEGNNEKMVGEGLKGLSRDSFVVGTAVLADGFDNRNGVFTTPLDVNAYIKKADASLARFGLDYVDILLFPFAGKKETVQHPPMLEAMRKLKEQGKTRFAGIAAHSDCAEALRSAADCGVYDVAMVAYNFKEPNPGSMNEALSYATKAGMGVVAMKTTAGVYRDKSKSNPLNSDALLKWVLQNKDITSIVSGMSTLEQLQKNLAMVKNPELTDQEKKDLSLASLGPEPGLYCHQCRKCVPQCIHNLEIPTAMRSYMYAYGYRNMEHAKYTLAEAGITGRPCENCDSCNVKCTAGFDIKERMLDISRLADVPSEFLV